MKKNSLSKNGLSLSQAQSISNLCNQRANEIENQLLIVNNFSKRVIVDGKEFETVKGVKLPNNIIDLLNEKAELHACQAFLMENMKAKENLLTVTKRESYITSNDIKNNIPEKPKFISPVALSEVVDEFGWEQLSISDYNEYLQAEAFASHIGQFIHKGGILASLRSEISKIPAIEWMNIKGDGSKSPVEIHVHHDSSKLLNVHESLAAKHRIYEQRVNYFKAKVKNIVTEENARIAKLNADAQHIAEKQNVDMQVIYETAMRKISEQINSAKTEFEKERQAKIKEYAALRINIDDRFQKTINSFLTEITSQE